MAGDRRLASKQLDLAVVEKRLEEAVHRWQVLAATSAFSIRSANLRTARQPEALAGASGTSSGYARPLSPVWAPLGEHALRVDDAEGPSCRGSPEPGHAGAALPEPPPGAGRLLRPPRAPLPLVLDDVLVNFDADRAKAAAAVLRDFAAAGHQLLVFTCHEHILKLFQSLKSPVIRLPGNDEPAEIVVSAEPLAEEKVKREKSPQPPAPQEGSEGGNHRGRVGGRRNTDRGRA